MAPSLTGEAAPDPRTATQRAPADSAGALAFWVGSGIGSSQGRMRSRTIQSSEARARR